MATFVLIHGAGHDGWCWSPLAEVLGRDGHRVVAPDLPCDDPDAGLEDYARVAAEALGADTTPVVVVGHSLGGLAAAMVADRVRATRLVFVAGIVGQPGRSLQDLADVDADRDLPLRDGEYETDDLDRMRFTVAGATRVLYHDCDPTLAAQACDHLRFQRSLWTEPLAIDDWPDIRVDSIVCREDRIINPAWSRRVAVERLGVQPIELPGGHSPMLSRPHDLAAVLVEH